MATMRTVIVAVGWRGIVAALGLFASAPARAANDPAVERGVQFLKSHAPGAKVGEAALGALAMLKAEVPPGDPAISACLAKVRARFTSGGYSAEQTGGHDIYEAAVVTLALANLEGESRRADLDAAAQYLIAKQNANGSWDYANRTGGDSSITQYAVLGLWEAENGGVAVPPRVWDRAASWYLSAQGSTGAWCYHPDERTMETLSMTAAGVGSLFICQRQLAPYRRAGEGLSKLLTPVTADGRQLKYDTGLSAEKVRQSTRRGMGWLGSHFTTSGAIIGPSIYYTLYGFERVGALADRETLGRLNWFDQGRQFILGTQRPDGAWSSSYGEVVNTAWAVLFLTRSTSKTIRKVQNRSLGAGTLQAGRGLPNDMSNLAVAGGRVINRPMSGAIDGMLSVLEDPRATQADAALAGLVVRYRAEGPGVLRPHKDRLRKLATDRDPGVRRLAAWALARTGDLDVAPALIAAVTDADEAVVEVARDGLRLLSRKLEGFGPETPSTAESRREAANRWRAWYSAIRPLDGDSADEGASRASK